jgi:hypothetical protein
MDELQHHHQEGCGGCASLSLATRLESNTRNGEDPKPRSFHRVV